jgi:hypothetical protein
MAAIAEQRKSATLDRWLSPSRRRRAGALLAAFALTACGGGGSSTPAPNSSSAVAPSPDGPSSPDYSQRVCGDELQAPEGMVVVDGRCDNEPEQPAGVYAEPSRKSRALGQAATGALLPGTCVASGEYTQDAAGVGSELWVRFDLGQALGSGSVTPIEGGNLGGGDIAYIPETWVDGDDQLDACPGDEAAAAIRKEVNS